MAFSPAPRMTPGVWGPYLGAALPGLWLNEGGQSASGALLDHILRLHGLDPTPATHARVIARVTELRAATPDLAPRLHVLPDFHGNRSPLADPHALGVISGLPLDSSFDALARLYWRTCVALALGLRAILERLNQHGYAIDTLHVTGGHTRNPLLMELYADATRCRTVEPVSPRRRPPRHRHGRRRRRRASTPPSPPPAPPCTRAAPSATPTRRRRRATSATGGRSWRCSGIGGRWSHPRLLEHFRINLARSRSW